MIKPLEKTKMSNDSAENDNVSLHAEGVFAID